MKKIYTLVLICSGTIFFGNLSFAQEQPRVLGADDNFIQKMKDDGASDEAIKKYLQSSHQPAIKQNFLPVPNASCADGFENGFTNWQGAVGTNLVAGSSPNWTSFSIQSPNHTIVSYSYTDICAKPSNPIPFPAPSFGDSSVRIGEPQTVGSVAEKLSYSFLVTPNDTSFLFTYATMIEDAGHMPGEQPYFSILMLDQIGDTIPNSYFYYQGGPNLTALGFDTAQCSFNTWYKPWTLRGVSLAAYIGQSVSLVAINADCIYGGHFAHSYFDMDCDGILYSPRYCPGGPVTLNANSEPNSQYLWDNGSTAAAITLNTPVAGDTVSCTVTPWGGYSFKANYLLTPAQAIFSSTVSTNTVTFTNTSDATVSCFWDFGDGNNSTSCNPTHVYSSAGTYTVCLTVQTDACNGVTSCSTVTILSTGINDQNLHSSITIMPNPASEIIMVDVKNIFLPPTIDATVYNLLGTEMSRGILSQQQGKYKMNVSLLPVGVYFVKLIIDNKEITKKIVVSREK